MIVWKNVPVILYAHDLHHASDTIINCIYKLIAGFSNCGWGQVKIILESRDVDHIRENTQWNKVQSNFQRNIWKDKSLNAINENDIITTIAGIIDSPHKRSIAEKLVNKSGANLQHLAVLFTTLLSEQVFVPEEIYENNSKYLRYNVKSYHSCVEVINSIPAARKDAIIELIQTIHSSLMQEGSIYACRLLGIIALIQFAPDIETLNELICGDRDIIQEELEQLCDEGFLQYRNYQYAFKHESYIEASLEWFSKIQSIKKWMRKNINSKLYPKRFSVALAKGRINHFLDLYDNSLEAYNAAIPLARNNFIQCVQCHKEIHNLILYEKNNKNYELFFNNYIALNKF